jgi:hypothetical protein
LKSPFLNLGLPLDANLSSAPVRCGVEIRVAAQPRPAGAKGHYVVGHKLEHAREIVRAGRGHPVDDERSNRPVHRGS